MLSETASGLQKNLNRLENYCDKWKLNVNLSKTKVVLFNCQKTSTFNFIYKKQSVDICESYCYLEIVFTSNGSFKNVDNFLKTKHRDVFLKLCQALNCLIIQVLTHIVNSLTVLSNQYCFMAQKFGVSHL